MAKPDWPRGDVAEEKSDDESSSNSSMSSDDEDFNPDQLGKPKDAKEEYDSKPSDTDSDSESGEEESSCSEAEGKRSEDKNRKSKKKTKLVEDGESSSDAAKVGKKIGLGSEKRPKE